MAWVNNTTGIYEHCLQVNKYPEGFFLVEQQFLDVWGRNEDGMKKSGVCFLLHLLCPVSERWRPGEWVKHSYQTSHQLSFSLCWKRFMFIIVAAHRQLPLTLSVNICQRCTDSHYSKCKLDHCIYKKRQTPPDILWHASVWALPLIQTLCSFPYPS